ncbi:M23 family metallopeptidase [Desulfatitalea alkaliphila]|uniref:M23 family metallopeptidase n=1 Tax=Desulfatitalea alkaliphila TaxID=2929485 RepID=A0AA41R4C9_9BACT|nr:M23 family metallopeptidase [Desulfatitalea alkaliphila]MCJ8500645.1 M23 family metallopeptidase [Desulfatitalea alkaliphila]
MAQKFSLFLVGGSGTKVRQLRISRGQCILLALLTLTLLSVIGYGMWDYVSIGREAARNSALQRELALRNEEVTLQRRQIQKFAREIDLLKERIVTLDQFEERIRILANLDQRDQQEGLFGVGGSAPEDLSPELDITRDHQQLMRRMHAQVRQLDNAAARRSGSFATLVEKLEERKNILAHTPAIRPAQGWVTSSFEYRRNPFTGKREFHRGMDIANRKGTPVVATADGVVSFIGERGAFGTLMVIDHGYGFTTRYAHLEKGLKQKGDRVQRGEVMAKMGSSGRSTGPHLHYEVRLNGVPVNPENYILN